MVQNKKELKKKRGEIISGISFSGCLQETAAKNDLQTELEKRVLKIHGRRGSDIKYISLRNWMIAHAKTVCKNTRQFC